MAIEFRGSVAVWILLLVWIGIGMSGLYPELITSINVLDIPFISNTLLSNVSAGIITFFATVIGYATTLKVLSSLPFTSWVFKL